MSLTVVAVILCLSAAIQLCYFLFLFLPATRDLDRNKRAATREAPCPPVSILICAYNEAENLGRHLPEILAQEYPDFEVIVVNDRSSDSTATVLDHFSKKYPRLRVVTISAEEPRIFPGKKLALSRGVTAATNEILLLTDADCQPASRHWISEMVGPLTKGKDIVAGFGDYHKEKGWLNAFIRGETLHTFWQLLAYQKAGMPYMAVGRNLACKKHLLERAQQHPLWKATPSGDDDVLIRLCATKENMAVATVPDSMTYSPAKKDFKSYLSQKQRHMSTGKLYRKNVSFLLALYALSHAAFWLSALLYGILVLLEKGVFSDWAVAAVFLFVLRNSIFWGYLKIFQKRLRRKENRLSFLPYFDFMWLGYNFAFSPYILWKTKQDWH